MTYRGWGCQATGAGEARGWPAGAVRRRCARSAPRDDDGAAADLALAKPRVDVERLIVGNRLDIDADLAGACHGGEVQQLRRGSPVARRDVGAVGQREEPDRERPGAKPMMTRRPSAHRIFAPVASVASAPTRSKTGVAPTSSVALRIASAAPTSEGMASLRRACGQLPACARRYRGDDIADTDGE
jgi:hypothetical protein